MTDTFELPPERLTYHCDSTLFSFKDTSELDPLDEVIGQKRAVQAIDFGLNMQSPGYNLFVTGVEGTGRSTIVKDIVGNYARRRPVPMDWCLVNNFLDPYRPVALSVPTGKALLFSKSMQRFIQGLKIRIPKEFKDPSCREKLAESHFRYSLYEERVHESYVDDTIMIDIDGDVIGQVNALAVYQMGDIAFGRPSRITAETYMGKHGIINIEREANLSGNTHDKGVLILSGYLGRTFAQKYPLNLSASIAFEQSYAGIDGDSASSTELYAILSSLSDVPIHQGIAVTGSVNQKGRIQAIGGVNQKVEGFYDVCKAKGFTGRQGVLIPKSNVKNLMLKKEVIDAVAAGKFHIYQVADIREGIEILTGTPAGGPDDRGDYPADSVYGKVRKKLRFYMEQSLRLRKEHEGLPPNP